jgi:YidC/Oxa1 family membrane protein insertase
LSIFEFIVYPFSQSLSLVADLFGGNYGLAVITITFILRIVLLPLFIKQTKQQKIMRDRLDEIKPNLEKLHEKYKDCKKPEDLKKKQTELVHLYKEHKINPFSIGCLPMLVQLPIVMGMYWAVLETSEQSNHFFMWFDFTETSILLAFIAALIYFFQGKYSQVPTVATTGQQNMSWMMWMSPIVIFVVSITSPAILPFYWSVNGLLLLAQSVILKMIA